MLRSMSRSITPLAEVDGLRDVSGGILALFADVDDGELLAGPDSLDDILHAALGDAGLGVVDKGEKAGRVLFGHGLIPDG